MCKNVKCDEVEETDQIDLLYPDAGCRTATLYLRICKDYNDSRCLSCPFPICIEELPRSDRYLLKRATKIKEIFKLLDQGLNSLAISQVINVKYTYVLKCKQKRDRIDHLLKEWSNFIQNKKAVELIRLN
jgi:hypothetical protein